MTDANSDLPPTAMNSPLPRASRTKTLFTAFGIGVGIVVVAVGLAVWSAFQPVSPSNHTKQKFVVAPGQSSTVIASHLAQGGLLKYPVVFRLVLKKQNLDASIQTGTFELSPDMTPQNLIQALTSKTNDVWVTIPEGWRREEIADSLAADTSLESFDKADFLSLTASEEGKLFPDTYLIAKASTAETVANLLRKTYDQKVTTGLKTEFATNKKSVNDILTMASLLEREARTYDQMRTVSGILWNRIDLGMPLQVDATLQYVKGYDPTNKTWWPVPTSVDRQQTSAFNTYMNKGLPPHPIANPGTDAIKAALDPQETDALFYIHDSQGQIHTAKTLKEHDALIDQYLK